MINYCRYYYYEIENNLTSEENRNLDNYYKNELETIYDHITDGIRIRSKCEWYEHGKKPRKFCLILEKSEASITESGNLLLKKKK